MKTFLLVTSIFYSIFLYSQKDSAEYQYHRINENVDYGYKKPKVFDLVTNIPKNYVDLGRGLKNKKNITWIGVTASTTGVLLISDQVILEDVQDFSQSINLSQDHSYKNIVYGVDYPTNISGALYHFGHGNVSLIFAGGFLATGLIKKDYRAIHTSIEIGESILTLGVLTQGLKRVFGRQSPNRSTVEGGEWNFFPNLGIYMKNTPNYDAMPSGHMATLISTVTVISKNYPEVKWVKPIGYTMAAVMGFEMMNSGVHWASDYPLGILIGYTAATVSVNRRIKKVEKQTIMSVRPSFKPQFFVSRLYGNTVYGFKAVF